MLKDRIKQYIAENDDGNVVFKEEKEFAEKYQIAENLAEQDPNLRFADAYIERCDKQTENMVRRETSEFLTQPLEYLKKQKDEFIYLESKWFDMVCVDSVSLEADDVFGMYDVMLGLKLQKKFAGKIRDFLDNHLQGDGSKFDLLFSGEDGLWNLNFALNYVDGFDENMSIGEAFQLIYHFLFKLMEAVEGEE